MMMNDVFLKIDLLSVGYGELLVLYDVMMEVCRVEIVVLVGSNGVGKIMLLCVLLCVIGIGGGSIIFDG